MESPLVPVVAHLRAGAYTCAAGGTILLYDILLTSNDEIRLIWPSRLSPVKCLYLVNRYLPVPCLILGMYHLAALREDLSTNNSSCNSDSDPNSCKLITLSQMIGQAVALVAATWLLVMRVVALYGGNKMVAIGLYAVFISTHLVTIIWSAILLHQLWLDLAYFQPLAICVSTASRTLGVVYMTPILCESVLVAMQLYHGYRHTRRLSTFLRPTTPLLRTLYADGFAYFVIVVTLRLWSALIFITADTSYWYISTYLEFSLISTSVSRLVLHLRRIAEVNHTLGPDDSIPLSRIAQNPASPANPGYNRRPHARDISSSFQNPAHTVYSYTSDLPPAPFSSSAYLRASQAFTSERGDSVVGETSHAGAVAGAGVSSRERGHVHDHAVSDEAGHRCELCADDFEGPGRENDHSYADLLPVVVVDRPRGRSREVVHAAEGVSGMHAGAGAGAGGEKGYPIEVEAPAVSHGIG